MAGETRKRVLLVDDSAASMRLLDKLFSDASRFEIIGRAVNGAEAVKLYQMLNPDLVVMDVIMPVMDGIQALRVIKHLDSNARVLIISSVAGDAHKAAELLRLGARGLITKPFDPQQVLSLIDSI